MSDRNFWTRTSKISRRGLLRGAAIGGAGLAGAALIGCGGDDDESVTGTSATQAPSSSSGGAAAPAAAPAAALPELSPSEFRDLPLSELREIYNPSYMQNLPGQIEAMKSGPTRGGTLKYYRTGPSTWDVLGTGAYAVASMPGTHSQLFRYKWAGDFGPAMEIQVEPDLPRSWSQPDDLTYVFKLPEEAVYWHDVAPVSGRQFTAEDLKFGVEALQAAPNQSQTLRDLDRVEVTDEETVVLRFNRPAAYFPITSCIPIQWLTAPEQVESSDGLAKWPIGTGAFQLVEAERNVNIVFERNPRYWKTDPIYNSGQKLPFLDRIEGVYMADAETAEAAWVAGQMDYAPFDSSYGPRRLIANAFEGRPDAVLSVVSPPPSYTNLIAMNSNTPPFNDVRVRRALSMAINREGMIEGLAGGFAGPSYSQNYAFFDRPDNPWPWTFDELGPYMKFDPAEAKKMLAAAGFNDGLGRKVELGFGTTDAGYNASIWLAMADSMSQELGIDLKMKMAVDSPAYRKTLYGEEYQDMHVATTQPAWDPDGFAYGQLNSKSPVNYFTVNDPLIDDLTEKQQTELDIDERRSLLMQIMDRDLDQMYRNWGLLTYKWTVRNPKLFNTGDHYLAWQTPGWGEYQLNLAWKQA